MARCHTLLNTPNITNCNIKKYTKMKPIYKRSLKVAAAVLATPIVLLVLLAVLLYIPPVQTWISAA